MIPWRPIAELPDELKDGREVLLWDEVPFVAVWIGEWRCSLGSIEPTHFAEITPP